jgi:putative membrane protein
MRVRALPIVTTALFAFTVALSAQTGVKTPTTAGVSGHADEMFVKEAAMGGMAEVELGQLAAQKATSERVKAFGQKMASDHGAANEELKSLAGAKQIVLDAELDARHKATLTRFQGLSGAAFDRAYIEDMTRDHEKDVAAFRRESQAGQDTQIKAFAAKTLPTLEEHLKMVRDLQREVGASTGN